MIREVVVVVVVVLLVKVVGRYPIKCWCTTVFLIYIYIGNSDLDIFNYRKAIWFG